MKTVTVVTQIGKVEIDIISRADKSMITLGLTNELIEQAMYVAIGKELQSVGGKWTKDNKPPAEWSN